MSAAAVSGTPGAAGRPVVRTVAAEPGVLRALVRREVRGLMTHPLVLLGIVLVAVAGTGSRPPDAGLQTGIVPGVFGLLCLVATAGRTRAADRLRRAAGEPPVPERTQTLAIAVACLAPTAVALVWWAWRWYQLVAHPPTGAWDFADAGTRFVLTYQLGQGPLAVLGGALLGLAVGRWFPRAGVTSLVVVAVVAVCIVLQGNFAALRTVHVLAPWTHWIGPFGWDTGTSTILLLPGSPGWWAVYLACLSGLALVVALGHDVEARGPVLRAWGVVLALAAVVAVVLAVLGGVAAPVAQTVA